MDLAGGPSLGRVHPSGAPRLRRRRLVAALVAGLAVWLMAAIGNASSSDISVARAGCRNALCRYGAPSFPGTSPVRTAATSASAFSSATPSARTSPPAAPGAQVVAAPASVAQTTATPAPRPPLRPAVTLSPSASPFAVTCGTGLCISGVHYRVKGATAYGQYGNPSWEVSTAKAAGVNTLEAVEFDTLYHQLGDTESAATWKRMDAFVAAAHSAGLHVILNLSEFGQSLQAAGDTMSSSQWQAQWNQYLTFIANRVNTVNGATYGRDPTILMVEMWGEIPAPAYANPVGTSAQLTAFFHNSLATWHSVAPAILGSTGGFSYLNNPSSGIAWQTIMSDPLDAVCGVEVNSFDDRNTSVGLVSRYCATAGKPWFLAAWSSCSKASAGTWDINDWLQSTVAATDAAMAAHIRDMYGIAGGAGPATDAAIGSDFWNLGPQTGSTCDLNASSPATASQSWAAVQAG